MIDCCSTSTRISLALLTALLLVAVGFSAADGYPAFGTQPVAVNQVGHMTAQPKRFTTPKASDGTSFSIQSSEGGAPLFRGEIQGNIGDFSEFRPKDSHQRYVVELGGKDEPLMTSDPFLIRSNLLQEQHWQAAVDFHIERRSAIGTHASAYGGSSWRDGTYYDAIIPSLVLLYLSDPKRAELMPKQIDWAADKKRVSAPDFKFSDKAPAGLKEKINEWVDVALSRSNNLWDFRIYDLADHWSIPKLNDIGNLLSYAPGSEMFPFNPKGAYRHPEGWVNYGASWCISLAYLQFDQAGNTPTPK